MNDSIGSQIQDLIQRGEELTRKPDTPVGSNSVNMANVVGNGVRPDGPDNLYGDGTSFNHQGPDVVTNQKAVDPRRTGLYPMTGGTNPQRAAAVAAEDLFRDPVPMGQRSTSLQTPPSGAPPAAGLGPRPGVPMPPHPGSPYDTPGALPLMHRRPH